MNIFGAVVGCSTGELGASTKVQGRVSIRMSSLSAPSNLIIGLDVNIYSVYAGSPFPVNLNSQKSGDCAIMPAQNINSLLGHRGSLLF